MANPSFRGLVVILECHQCAVFGTYWPHHDSVGIFHKTVPRFDETPL